MRPTRYYHRPPPPADEPTAARAQPSARQAAPDEPQRLKPRAPPMRPSQEPGERTTSRVRTPHWVALAGLCLLALALRLKDPLSSVVIGAEDPYLHMERTWDFLQGEPVRDYPVGFMALLAPVAAFGPDAFYWSARFLPPFLGVAAVLSTFLLLKPYVRPAAALVGCAMVATMPEHIVRTNLLFPTAVDLAAIPLIVLGVLRISEGDTRAAWAVAAGAAILLLIHPWAVGLMAVPFGAYAGIQMLRRSDAPAWTSTATVGGVGAVVLALWMLPVWTPTELLFGRALPTLGSLLANPTSYSVPQHVHFPHMLTWAGLALGAAGAVVAGLRRSRFAMMALIWVGLLLPIVVVDWFDIWFIPHRTVAFLTVGLVMLGALAIDEALERIGQHTPKNRRPAGWVLLGLVLLLMLPSAAATPNWYRLYDEDDYAAWHELEALDTPYVVTGSWQARAGYRALTGLDATYSPAFFTDENARNATLEQHPRLIVLVDAHAREAGTPTQFLDGWRSVGRWGDVAAYEAPR